MSIDLGWWLIPAILTLVVFIWAGRYEKPVNFGFDFPDIEGMLRYGAASIVSLMAWLVWAVLR